MKFTKTYFILYNIFAVVYSLGVALFLPKVFKTSEMAIAFAILYALLYEKYENKIPDVMLWIDENLNHKFFENFTHWNYWFWEHTSYAFCLWVCDNFEKFEE